MLRINCKYCCYSVECNKDECQMYTPFLMEIQEMQSFLEITANDNPQELVQRLTDINVYMARSGKLLADAKAIQDEMTAEIYKEHDVFISRVPATIATKFISSQSVTINQIVNWLDRINRTLVHASDNIRTQISFAKQDMSLQRKGY